MLIFFYKDLFKLAILKLAWLKLNEIASSSSTDVLQATPYDKLSQPTVLIPNMLEITSHG